MGPQITTCKLCLQSEDSHVFTWLLGFLGKPGLEARRFVLEHGCEKTISVRTGNHVFGAELFLTLKFPADLLGEGTKSGPTA